MEQKTTPKQHLDKAERFYSQAEMAILNHNLDIATDRLYWCIYHLFVALALAGGEKPERDPDELRNQVYGLHYFTSDGFDNYYEQLFCILEDKRETVIYTIENPLDRETTTDWLFTARKFMQEAGEKVRLEVEREYAHTVGMSIGVAQGRKEEKIAVAKNMLALSLPKDIISKATGLTEEELSKL